MRQVISGSGLDVTATVRTYLKNHNQLSVFHLYLIGDPDDPRAIYMTDYEAPLTWNVYGKFNPSVIRRGRVNSQIGLEADSVDIEWSPQNITPGTTIATASPYQLAAIGYYDNWPVRIWKCYMPAPGDADTYGCSELFGGYIGDVSVERALIKFTVNSFLIVVDQQVPTNTIELTNTVAGYTGATPPAGQSAVPQFSVVSASETAIICDEISPDAGHIFDGDWNGHSPQLRNGFLVFNPGMGSTLAKVWSAVYSNDRIPKVGPGPYHNEILLYTALPWAPTPGVDTFYLSRQAPVNKDELGYLGFPFVPVPQAAV